MTDQQLTHIDEQGDVRMVDVSHKADTERVAVAEGFISMKPETLAPVSYTHLTLPTTSRV